MIEHTEREREREREREKSHPWWLDSHEDHHGKQIFFFLLCNEWWIDFCFLSMFFIFLSEENIIHYKNKSKTFKLINRKKTNSVGHLEIQL